MGDEEAEFGRRLFVTAVTAPVSLINALAW